MMRKMVACGVLLLGGLPAFAGDQSAARLQAVAPFLDPQTFAVAHVDLNRVDVNAVINQVRKVSGLPEILLAKPRRDLHALVSSLKHAGARDVYVVLSLADLPMQPPLVIVPLTEHSDAAALSKILKHEAVGTVHNAIVAGSEQALDRLKHQKPVTLPGLAEGFAAAGDTAAQGVITVSSDTRRVIREMLPTLPKELGGGPSSVLTQGIRWAALGVNLPPKTSARLVIHSQNGQAAEKLKDWLADRLQQRTRMPGVETLYPNIGKLVMALKPQVRGAQLVFTLNERDLALLKPPVRKVMEARARAESSNHLRQILLAMHNYADAHGHFPAHAIKSKDGKPLLSWRVAILPFVEQQKLYQQFHLNEPWDSPHNKKLIAQMPAVYQSSVRLTPQGKTTYLAVRGKHMMFPDDHGVTFKDITDGTSNTIAVVDANDEHGVPWTKPDDFRPDAKNPLNGLLGHFAHGFFAAFADGSVHLIAGTIKSSTLRALFTRDGGEVSDFDDR